MELNGFFNLSVKYVSLLILPISMAVIILSQDLVRVVYGAGYLQAPLYLAAYSTLFLLTGLGYAVTDNLFNGAGETKLTFKTSIVYLSVFVAAAPALRGYTAF